MSKIGERFREVFRGKQIAPQATIQLTSPGFVIPDAPPQTEEQRFRESWGLPMFGTSDPDKDDALFRYVGGIKSQTIRPPWFDRMTMAWSSYLFESNPLAAAVTKLTAEYVSSSVAIKCRNRLVEAHVDRFIKDPTNGVFARPMEAFMRYRIYGKLALAAVVGDDGHVRLLAMSPYQIGPMEFAHENEYEPDTVQIVDSTAVRERSISDKSNNEWGLGERAKGAVLDPRYLVTPPNRHPIPSDSGGKEGKDVWRIIRQRDRDESWRGDFEAFDSTPLLDGSCFLFRANAITSPYGRGDLVEILATIDQHSALLKAQVIRAQLLSSFAYQINIPSATQEQLKQLKAEYRMPRPGQVIFLTGGSTLSAISPALEAGESTELLRAIKSHILAAAGFPPSWIGEDSANRATALAQGEPTLKRLQAMQEEWREVIKDLVQFSIDSGIYHGTLPADIKRDEFEVILPSMSTDSAAAVQVSGAVVDAIRTAVEGGLLHKTVGQKIVENMMVKAGLIESDDIKTMLGMQDVDDTPPPSAAQSQLGQEMAGGGGENTLAAEIGAAPPPEQAPPAQEARRWR